MIQSGYIFSALDNLFTGTGTSFVVYINFLDYSNVVLLLVLPTCSLLSLSVVYYYYYYNYYYYYFFFDDKLGALVILLSFVK